ncbi:lipopolysaccharide biosynthesis protein, partial [Fulvivirga sp. RKSG066]|uniref:lipopolysaccharide biosynthesis protein n=1 Tax=Fulvivirga aurantia TaxID=2529383 RepID=UPI0012BBA095
FVSILIYIVFFFGSYGIAKLYDKPELVLLTKILALQFIILAFNITQRVQLTKVIDFKTLTLFRIVSGLLSFGVAISMALQGFGVWAIVGQLLSQKILSVILLGFKIKWQPKFVFSISSFKKFAGFGFKVTANSFLNYLSRNFDNFVIGKFIGDSSLGIYSKAYGIILFPIKNFSEVIKKVLFPSFSLIQTSVSDVKAYYLKVTHLTAFVVFPVMALAIIQAENLVLILLGHAWVAMVPLMKIFGLLGMVQSVLTVNATIYLSQGRPGLAFKVGLFSKSVIILGIVVGLYVDGLMGVAYGLLAAQIINFYPVFTTAAKLIDLTLKEQVVNLKVTVFSLICASLPTYFLTIYVEASRLVEIICVSGVFTLVYLLIS